MKATYLIRKVGADGSEKLAIGTRAEWRIIRERNKELPSEQKRYFILDCIEEADGLDRMYIEVSRDEYRKWKTEAKARERNRKRAAQYQHLSLDANIYDSEITSLHECVGDGGADVELDALEKVLLEQLRAALQDWEPWAEEMLDYYLDSRKRYCNADLMSMYGWSERTTRRRKQSFELFIKNFFEIGGRFD